MVVTCENCESKFKLDDSLIKDSGSKVRCSNCQHVFTVFKPEPQEEPTTEEQILGVSDEAEEEPLDFDLFESEPDESDGTSLEDFGLEEETDGLKAEAGGAEQGVSEDQITAEDLGFGDGFSEETGIQAETDLPGAEEDLGLEGLSLEKDAPGEEDLGAPVEVGETGLQEEEEAISFEDLTLAGEPEAGVTGQAAEDEGETLAFDDLSLEDESGVEDLAEAAADEEALAFDEGELEVASSRDERLPEEGMAEELLAEAAEGADAFPEGVPVASLEDGEELEQDLFEDMPPPAVAEKAAAGRRISMPLMILLIVVLLGGGAYGAFTFLQGSDIKIPFLESIAGVKDSDAVDGGNLHITLLEEMIDGEFVDNGKMGRLFVIKGKIRSNYPEARNFIRMKGVLYFRDGKVAQDKIVYCGNVLTDTELQSLDREEIKNRLSNRFGDNKSNFRVPSGKMLPFMVVFTDIPEELGEFSVEVVDSLPG